MPCPLSKIHIFRNSNEFQSGKIKIHNKMHYSKKTQSKQTKMQNTKDKKKILKTTREKKNDFNKSLK